MENKQQQILSEMSALLAALKSQVEELEIKMSEYQYVLDNQSVVEVCAQESETVEEFVAEVEESVVEEPVVEDPVVEEPVVEEVEEEVEVVVEIEDADEPEIEAEADMFEMEVMDIELDPSDDLPFYDDATVELPQIQEQVAEEPAAPVAVIDAMTAKQAWRTDMPGSPVRDIRSAISLNDRILFINYLFGEDPMSFQDMLTKLNSMTSFDEAASYVIAANPDWDLESDTVYRFMMAIRRRLQ